MRACGGTLLTVARRLLVDEQEARRAVETALVGALQAAPDIPESEELSLWLLDRLVRAVLILAGRPTPESEASLHGLLPRFNTDGTHASPVAEWRMLPGGGAQPPEARRRVRAAVARLPTPYRVVLILHDAEGLGPEEVARLMNLDARETRSRLHRARQSLRTQIAPIFSGLRAPGVSPSSSISAPRPVP